MQVVILGGTGKIGGLALARALADGHQVIALVRDPAKLDMSPRLTSVAGDLTDPQTVREAMKGADAVIAAVGPRANSIGDELALEAGMRNVVAAMTELGVRRLVALSGAGIDVPGDEKPWLDRVASRLVRRMAKHVVGAKQREFEVFSVADLDWTAVRPPLVTDGPPVGYRLAQRLTPGARVRRADVAAALVDQLTDTGFVRAAPFVLPPDDRASVNPRAPRRSA